MDSENTIPEFPLAFAAGTAAVAVGCAVLAGWALGSEALTTILPGRASMKPNTALCFIFLGVGLWAKSVKAPAIGARRLASICASLVLLVGLTTLGEYLFGWDPGIDRLLFPEPRPTFTTPHVGRMGANTAFCFVLLATSVLVWEALRSRVSEACAVLTTAIAGFSVIGHLYGVVPTTSFTIGATQMALHTSVLFVVLGAATVWTVPQGRIKDLLVSNGPGGLTARRLIPIIFFALVTLGGLRLLGQRVGLYGTEFGLAIMVSLAILVLTGSVLWSATVINRLDAARRASEDAQRAVEMKLDALKEADRLKNSFVASMSHELRTPLNAINGFSELMIDEKAGPVTEKQREYLGDVLDAAGHLLELVDSILDIAKAQAGKLEFRLERVSLPQLALEAQGMFRVLADGKDIRIESQFDPSLGSVQLDSTRFKQVLYNFVSNAIKFTPRGGRITLRALPESRDFFRLEVEDTGIGIQEERIPLLFQEFRQVHSADVANKRGTGLGLALTKRIVEAQGGRVGVTSSLGQGSVFYALLPRIEG